MSPLGLVNHPCVVCTTAKQYGLIQMFALQLINIVRMMHVTNGYKCYLFVIKSFCVANLCGYSQPQKYFNNKSMV